MKISLFMVPRLTHGGGCERYFINLANYLCDRGHEVKIITSNQLEYRFLMVFLNIIYGNPILYNNNRLNKQDVAHSLLPGVCLVEAHMWDMWKWLHQADVIYAKNEILDLVALHAISLTARRQLPPVVVGVHTPIRYPVARSLLARIHNMLYLGPLYRKLLRFSRAIHISNEYDIFITRWFKGNINIYKIPYPFNVDEYIKIERYKNDQFSVLFSGRLTEQKGVDLLVEIITACAEDKLLADTHWTIAGSGEPRYENTISALANRTAHVTFMGYVPHDRLVDLYAKHAVVVVPSRWETLPYVCLEAQACGVPVIASNIPGPADIILHGETGLLVEPTVEGFVGALRALRQTWERQPQTIIEMGRRAQQRIASHFSPASIFPKLEAMLTDVAGSPQ